MPPKDKYTIYSPHDRKYRKGIHKVPKWTRVCSKRTYVTPHSFDLLRSSRFARTPRASEDTLSLASLYTIQRVIYAEGSLETIWISATPYTSLTTKPTGSSPA